MSAPKALDLFCCAGGASMGLFLAGFDVTGVDIDPQPHYCATRGDSVLANGRRFVQADAMTFDLRGYDFVWASPPCQRYSNAQRIMKNDHPDLIEPIRRRLIAAGIPYCIENVVGAPLLDPIELCGAMFPRLLVYRHRLFECSFPVEQPAHPEHRWPLRKMGRPPRDREFMHVVGHFSDVKRAREAMGIDWMTRETLREAIPPEYATYIGRAARANILSNRKAA